MLHIFLTYLLGTKKGEFDTEHSEPKTSDEKRDQSNHVSFRSFVKWNGPGGGTAIYGLYGYMPRNTAEYGMVCLKPGTPEHPGTLEQSKKPGTPILMVLFVVLLQTM